jgi:hypothetical protein
VEGAGALLETEEKVMKRKLGTAPNPERGGEIKRERDDCSAQQTG